MSPCSKELPTRLRWQQRPVAITFLWHLSRIRRVWPPALGTDLPVVVPRSKVGMRIRVLAEAFRKEHHSRRIDET